MKHQNHILMLSVSFMYLLGQLATGTSVYVASLFSVAILFGLYSVWAAGGLFTAFGALNAILIAKFLLIGIVLKIVIQDPADKNLFSPESTAAVLAIGFLGLLLGTSVQGRLPRPQSPLIQEVSSARLYLALTIVFFVFGCSGYLIGMSPDLAGEGIQTGGILGIARALGSLRFFSIVPALYFAWSSGSRRFMTHPLVIFVLLAGVLDGIFTTSKLGAMETLVFYMLVGVSRYGLRDKRLLALGAIGIFYYSAIVYPYSQYVRSHGGREGGLSERVQAIKDVFERVATNRDFRGDILATAYDPNGSYLGNEALTPFGRLAMVGEADKLVTATIEQQAWTGWETITWGFKLAAPSFVYHDKPVFGTGNYLGHIAGEVGKQDLATQISYGVMANFFNAFSYPGVLVGTAVFFCCFYYVLCLFFGNPHCSSKPSGSTVWFLLVVTTFQHSLVEESVAGLIAGVLDVVVLVLALYIMARAICNLLPTSAAIEVFE